MLLTQKAFVEGGRVLAFLTGREIDGAHTTPNPRCASARSTWSHS